MQNSIRQTASGDESGLKPAPDSQTGELKFFSSRGLFFFQTEKQKIASLVTAVQI